MNYKPMRVEELNDLVTKWMAERPRKTTLLTRAYDGQHEKAEYAEFLAGEFATFVSQVDRETLFEVLNIIEELREDVDIDARDRR